MERGHHASHSTLSPGTSESLGSGSQDYALHSLVEEKACSGGQCSDHLCKTSMQQHEKEQKTQGTESCCPDQEVDVT